MQLVDNESFFAQLTKLFKASEDHGSIWLTHKRLTHDGDAGEEESREYPCLVRVTNGKEAAFSTRVEPGQLDAFHATYGSLLKSSMTTLRRRDKKREKQHADEAAKRKRRMTLPIAIEGPKRGNGRKQRQRRVKAALKQDEAKVKFEAREEAAKEKEKAKELHMMV